MHSTVGRVFVRLNLLKTLSYQQVLSAARVSRVLIISNGISTFSSGVSSLRNCQHIVWLCRILTAAQKRITPVPCPISATPTMARFPIRSICSPHPLSCSTVG
uniref:Uncharacterized protein n=1 Tax=Cacopsylla melanoneura TaxID=428564 RepID=A0A8D8LRH0_9HEMI